MYVQYFPTCPVNGPILPAIPYSHMDCIGAVPNKCGHCAMLFEGECNRAGSELGGFRHLDHGPCGIEGPTDPVSYEDQFVSSKVTVPRKCSTCCYLDIDMVYGFNCRKDASTWGHFHRGLDWGEWRPEHPHVELDHPRKTTKALVELAFQNLRIELVEEYRRVNPGLSMTEALADFRRIQTALNNNK